MLYAAIIGVALFFIQKRREEVLAHNRAVQAADAAAQAEASAPQDMCADLEVVAKRANATITSCTQTGDWVTVSIASHNRDSIGEFLWQAATSGHTQIDKSNPKGFFRETRDAAGRPVFEDTFRLQYKP